MEVRVKKRIADLVKIGVLVPALIVSMAACGAASAQDNGGGEAAGAADTTVAENTGDTAGEMIEEKTEEKTEETATQPAEGKVYENKGYKITVPAELADKITVETPEVSEDGVIFNCFETKSVEAAKGTERENMSPGWLFAITERDEESTRQILANDYPGQEPIAKAEDGTYFIYNHPTDVRYERATPEEMEKDQDEWTAACEWADSVSKSFAADNGLTRIYYSGTVIEAALGKAAFDENANYTLSTTELGTLEPKDVDPVAYYERLTNGATFESIDLEENEVPDGEYVVLTFPDENIRYDFFLAEGKENIIRQVIGAEGEEQYSYFFKVTYEDGTTKASEIMNEWCHALAENK